MSDQEFESPSLNIQNSKPYLSTVAVPIGCQRILYGFYSRVATAFICSIGLSLSSLLSLGLSHSLRQDQNQGANLGWLANVGTASATTLVQTPLFRVAEQAELIFEGLVVKTSNQLSVQHSQALNTSDLPYTYFTFKINEIIKGSYAGKQIVLGFAGGTANGLTTKVSDLHMPEPGEHGIYFVESLDQQLLNPLYGWHQGHYIVQEQGNKLTVSPLIRAPIRNQNPLVPQTVRAKTSLEDFKREIRHMYHSPQSS